MVKTDIAVVGGGASGLSAAISAKRTSPDADVLILERGARVGSKILATGNGRCNLGNKNISREHYHDSVDAVSVITSAQPAETYFAGMGVLCTADPQGRIYPRSGSAATVLNALRTTALELGVKEVCGFDVRSVVEYVNGYVMGSAAGDEVMADRVVIAAGGYASPQHGTDGSVMRILREMGYKTAKICPAVAPLRVSPELLKGLKGVRARGSISAYSGTKLLGSESGEIQFNEDSISGICVFSLAYLFAEHEGRLTLCADLAPDMFEEQITAYLRSVCTLRPRGEVSELLMGMFAKPLALYLAKKAVSRPLSDPLGSLSEPELSAVTRCVKSLGFPVSGCAPWKGAQATMGGISAENVDDDLRSRLHRGIWLCGEVLDVVGDCGGYNLQWAWASGQKAGANAADSLKGARR
ncbi:MAG: aminoacetone oxidase family FAD-binding enzyme [Ruminococcus sp.]|nr:aminoacetone oxidase family FAD-binding enzyme [Ruminococcus sp.]